MKYKSHLRKIALLLWLALLYSIVIKAETSFVNSFTFVINEIHADPAGKFGDANGDGVRDSSDDEFVEIVNTSGQAVDISGWTISDEDLGVRHTFPAGTVIPDMCAVVVFGGGTPTGTFGGSYVSTASTGKVGFSNAGDTVTLKDGTDTIHATYTYTGTGDVDQSLTRDPDITGVDPLVIHSTATGSGGALFSPGTRIDGSVFSGCTQQLLLAEVVVTPTTAEFIEIYNPGTAAVDLSNVYLTDATAAGGSTYYYNLVTGANAGGGSSADFNARFPAGATIAGGEYQTIALAGSDTFSTTYGVNPTYELYEDGGSADAIPDMREATAGSINNQGDLSDSGEVVILYAWDGASDLVVDLDYFVWGDKAEAVDKAGVAVDGPDAGPETSTYLPDTPIASQDVVAAASHALDNSWQRADLSEGSELKGGGNGASGHDETSENVSRTWCEISPSPNAASDCPPDFYSFLPAIIK